MRSRLDRRRSLKESDQAPRGPDPSAPGVHRRRPALPPARRGGASRRRRPWCSSRWTSRRACATATASSRRRSSSGSCRACGASTATSRPCSSRTPIEAWEFSESEFFQVQRLGRHGRVLGVRARCARSSTSATTRRATTSTCSTPPTARTADDDREPRERRCASSRALASYMRLRRDRRPPPQHALETETARHLRGSWPATAPPAAAYALTTAGVRLGRDPRTSSAEQAARRRLAHRERDRQLARATCRRLEDAGPARRASTTTRCSSRRCPTAS